MKNLFQKYCYETFEKFRKVSEIYNPEVTSPEDKIVLWKNRGGE